MIITFTEEVLSILLEFVVNLNDPLLWLVHKIEDLMIDQNKQKYTYLVVGRELDRLLEVFQECLESSWVSEEELYAIKNMARKEE